MLLSIVSGTFNRLNYLTRMIASVRMQLPKHIAYEFVIVDAGSKDGTIEWCKSQPDIVLIEHGELRGAIKAFTEGARAARGTYVVMANDDLEFHPYSIMRAIAYLEDHRTCGAVAFADNRSMQVGRADKHQTEGQPAIGIDGKPAWVTYAQVGMFRGWLGNKVGWWGADDPIMGQARTYGGDNYLTSRLWELGYSVDAVEGCTVDDLIARDGLRARNNDQGEADSKCYYRAYPYGPQLKAAPEVPNPQHDSLRTLVLDIHDPRLPARTAKEYGLAEAFAKVSLCYHVDQANESFDLVKLVETWQPHVCFIQLHDTSKIDASVLSRARAAKPDCVFLSWNGDAHLSGLVAPDILETLKYVDLHLIVNMKAAPIYDHHGIKYAYWQISYKAPAAPYEGEVPEHDILWQGNCYSPDRVALVTAIQEMPYNVGVYGHCPNSDGFTHYDFAQQAALYASAAIVISDTFPDTEGYVSNRLFQALGAGAFVLQQHSPRLDELTGLRAGEHYIEWRDLRDMHRLIKEWVQPECAEMRRAIAQQGMEFVRREYNYDASLRRLWKLLP